MSYLGELRDNMRPLAAASIGAGASLPLFAYTNSVFSPHLIKEFGWSRAQFALVGVTMLATLLVLPFIGRFTDKLGVRRMALIGTLTLPLCFIGFSQMNGSFGFFLTVSTLMLMIGAFTGPLVYTRLIAENFERTTGLALTIMNCVPAVLAIVIVPLLNSAIETIGWRLSYIALGGFALVCGLTALAIMPPATAQAQRDRETFHDREHPAQNDYGLILRSGTFWVIFTAMFLCLVGTPLHAAQMNIMLLDNGLTTQTAANIVSVYAFGTIVGRIVCGLALDRFSTPVVTAISMGLPAIGFFLLGTNWDAVSVITLSMFLVGLSVGAESDLIAYLVARYFKLRIYNTTLALLHCCNFLAAAVGALTISLVLRLTDSFAPFLFLVSGSIAIGCTLFLMMPRRRGQKIG